MKCPRCGTNLEPWRSPRTGQWHWLHGLSNSCDLSLARWGGVGTREALADDSALVLHKATPESVSLVSQHIDRYRCEVSPLARLEAQVRELMREVRAAKEQARESVQD